MPTVDLRAPGTVPSAATPAGLEYLPRRLTLTARELRHLAGLARSPLPFPSFGPRRPDTPQSAYAAAVADQPDPVDTLHRRGLLVDGTADPHLLAALRVLAAPALAVDLSVGVRGDEVHSWHRQSGPAVTALSTSDGLVHELAWFAVELWAAELAQVAVQPEACPSTASVVPDRLDLPFELADAAVEAVRTGRGELLPRLVAVHAGGMYDAEGRPGSAMSTVEILRGLATEPRGRLRALCTDATSSTTTAVGVVAWVLLADGWRSLTARVGDGGRRLQVTRVEPADLPAHLGPVLARVRT